MKFNNKPHMHIVTSFSNGFVGSMIWWESTVETSSFCMWLMAFLPADPALAQETSPWGREQGLWAPLLQGHAAPGHQSPWGADTVKPLPEKPFSLRPRDEGEDCVRQ